MSKPKRVPALALVFLWLFVAATLYGLSLPGNGMITSNITNAVGVGTTAGLILGFVYLVLWLGKASIERLFEAYTRAYPHGNTSQDEPV